MKIPYSFVLVFIYVGLLFISAMVIRETVHEPIHEQPENFENIKYMSVKAESAMRSLCSKSNFLMKLYRLRQDEIFAAMKPGMDTSSTVKRLDSQIENVQDMMDRDRKILEEEGVFEQANMNCTYRP